MPEIVTKEWLYGKLSLLEPYYLPTVVVLVGLSAFGLGRLSVTGFPQAPQEPAAAVKTQEMPALNCPGL